MDAKRCIIGPARSGRSVVSTLDMVNKIPDTGAMVDSASGRESPGQNRRSLEARANLGAVFACTAKSPEGRDVW
ncbi:hypothetical protein [Catenulispora acidiphila]|uniref:hypothetical protein n=1 Tax=Catenulispora acidiphila TaxID=304895 RepID=UPI00117E766A|nr:hypothetical protein [Catenulispora acidiphila]